MSRCDFRHMRCFYASYSLRRTACIKNGFKTQMFFMCLQELLLIICDDFFSRGEFLSHSLLRDSYLTSLSHCLGPYLYRVTKGASILRAVDRPNPKATLPSCCVFFRHSLSASRHSCEDGYLPRQQWRPRIAKQPYRPRLWVCLQTSSFFQYGPHFEVTARWLLSQR